MPALLFGEEINRDRVERCGEGERVAAPGNFNYR